MHRLSSFKVPPLHQTQQARRQQALEEQKRRRAQKVDVTRNLAFFADITLSDDEDAKSGKPARKRTSKWANVAMHAEPLEIGDTRESLPQDFPASWVAIGPLPRGKRCILVTSKSSGQGSHVCLRSRLKGHKVLYFTSSVPPDTILDCILDENWADTGIIHVLDVLRWKGQDFEECEAQFRFWWRDVKLAELPPSAPAWDDSHTRLTYPHILQPVPCHTSLADDPQILVNLIEGAGAKSISPAAAYASLTSQSQSLPDAMPSDGILFYEATAFYERGDSVLAAWVPSMPLQEGMDVPLERLAKLFQALPDTDME